MNGAPFPLPEEKRVCGFCGKPVPVSRSRNRKIKKEFCRRSCKDAFGIVARQYGRRFLFIPMPPEKREELLAMIEKERGEVRIAAARPPAEMIDLGRMSPMERRTELLRAAARQGVMEGSI